MSRSWGEGGGGKGAKTSPGVPRTPLSLKFCAGKFVRKATETSLQTIDILATNAHPPGKGVRGTLGLVH